MPHAHIVASIHEVCAAGTLPHFKEEHFVGCVVRNIRNRLFPATGGTTKRAVHFGCINNTQAPFPSSVVLNASGCRRNVVRPSHVLPMSATTGVADATVRSLRAREAAVSHASPLSPRAQRILQDAAVLEGHAAAAEKRLRLEEHRAARSRAAFHAQGTLGVDATTNAASEIGAIRAQAERSFAYRDRAAREMQARQAQLALHTSSECPFLRSPSG